MRDNSVAVRLDVDWRRGWNVACRVGDRGWAPGHWRERAAGEAEHSGHGVDEPFAVCAGSAVDGCRAGGRAVAGPAWGVIAATDGGHAEPAATGARGEPGD